MTKQQAISEMILDGIDASGSIEQGFRESFDRVLGAGSYDKLVSDLYDALQ